MPTIYETVADEETIEKAIKALKVNGFNASVVETKEAAKDTILKLIPPGSEIQTVTSATVADLGLATIFNESSEYNSIRAKIMENANNPAKQKFIKQIASAPDFVIGSVHALTEDGHLMIASASGSQIAPEVYGANKVVYVVGAQKIVKNVDAGFKRIIEHSLPLEDERALKAYGAHTSLNKLFIFYKERPERVSVIIIKQNIGF